jgi:ABC-type transport system involved in multi-copper enzyme maturation permease subunit
MSDTMPVDGQAQVDDTQTISTTVEEGARSVATTAVRSRSRVIRAPRNVRRTIGEGLAGLTAVGVKELRGRMRGRRAFVILTIYLLLLGSFAWMMELILERQYAGTVANSAAYASSQIGQGIFVALVMLETLLVVALAPAFTAGAISLEREKQTLDMLATTPVSSLSIVVGKLFSALTYLFILIFASIPLTAIVFVFGGVAPDDVIRGYAVLLTTALGLGSMGIFFSALIKRTQAATIITYFAVGAATLGAFFIYFFWNTMTNGAGLVTQGIGPIKGRPPEALLYLNPYFAQADVVCGVENGFGDWCERVAFVSDRSIFSGTSGFMTDPGIAAPPDGGIVNKGGGRLAPVPQPVPPSTGVDDFVGDVSVQPFEVIRDSFWPKSAVAWLILSVVLILATVQLVSPTRRWRPGLPRAFRRGSAA